MSTTYQSHYLFCDSRHLKRLSKHWASQPKSSCSFGREIRNRSDYWLFLAYWYRYWSEYGKPRNTDAAFKPCPCWRFYWDLPGVKNPCTGRLCAVRRSHVIWWLPIAVISLFLLFPYFCYFPINVISRFLTYLYCRYVHAVYLRQ